MDQEQSGQWPEEEGNLCATTQDPPILSNVLLIRTSVASRDEGGIPHWRSESDVSWVLVWIVICLCWQPSSRELLRRLHWGMRQPSNHTFSLQRNDGETTGFLFPGRWFVSVESHFPRVGTCFPSRR